MNKYFNSKKLFCVYDPLHQYLSNFYFILLPHTQLTYQQYSSSSNSDILLMKMTNEGMTSISRMVKRKNKKNYARHRPNREMHFVPVINNIDSWCWDVVCCCIQLKETVYTTLFSLLYRVQSKTHNYDRRKCRLHVFL
jgi:hypothetical protein